MEEIAMATALNYSSFPNEFAFDFDGTGSVEIGDVLNIDKDTPFTLAFFIKKEAGGSNEGIFVKKDGGAGYTIRTNNTQIVVDFDTASTDSLRIRTNTSLGLNVWRFVLITKGTGISVSALQVYFEDSVQGRTVLDNNLTNSTVNNEILKIGGSLTGLLDEITFWGKEFTQAEVTELYNNGKVFDYLTHSAAANLQAWWRAEGNANDIGGNNYHGTLVGGATFSSK